MLRQTDDNPLALQYQINGQHFLGSIYLYRFELRSANRHLKAGWQLAKQVNLPRQEANFLLKLSWLSLVQHQLPVAFQYGEELLQLASNLQDEVFLRQMAEAHLAFLAQQSGRWQGAQNWLNIQPAGIASPKIPFDFSRQANILSWLVLKIAQEPAGATQALEQLHLLQDNARYKNNPRLQIDLNCLQAIAHYRLKRMEDALDWIKIALRDANRLQYFLPFALVGEEMPALVKLALKANIQPALCHKLLKTICPPTYVPANDALVTLTKREREILTLVSAGMSNQQICDQLHLSINTIKSHLKRINHKLGVTNRTAAVMQAQLLNLL